MKISINKRIAEDIEKYYQTPLLDYESQSNKEKTKEVLCLFITRIFGKIIQDLGEDITVKDWDIKDWLNLFDRMGDIDINQDEYRLYFKELAVFMINYINNKNA